MKTISGLLKGEPKAQKFLGEGPWGTFLLWSRPSDQMASEWTMVHSVYEDFGTEVLLFPIFWEDANCSSVSLSSSSSSSVLFTFLSHILFPHFPLRLVKWVCRVRWNREKFSKAALVFILGAAFIELWRTLGSANLTSQRQIKAWPRTKPNLFLVIEAELESRFPDSQSRSCFYLPGCLLALCVCGPCKQ